MHAAPPIIGFLAKHPSVEAVLPLPRLREVMSGAAPLGAELASAAMGRLGLRELRQGCTPLPAPDTFAPAVADGCAASGRRHD